MSFLGKLHAFHNKATVDQNIIGIPLRTHLQRNGKYWISENVVCTHEGTMKCYLEKNLKICVGKGAISENDSLKAENNHLNRATLITLFPELYFISS